MTSVSAKRQLQPAPWHRGVYKLRGKIFGRNAYYALTSEKEFLGGSVHIVSDTQSDAEIVSRLFVDLDRADPVRPTLQLVKSVVTASIDGPSPSHPQISSVEWDGNVIPFRLPSDGSDATTRRVYENLYQQLYGVLPSWPRPDEPPELDHSPVLPQ